MTVGESQDVADWRVAQNYVCSHYQLLPFLKPTFRHEIPVFWSKIFVKIKKTMCVDWMGLTPDCYCGCYLC